MYATGQASTNIFHPRWNYENNSNFKLLLFQTYFAKRMQKVKKGLTTLFEPEM